MNHRQSQISHVGVNVNLMVKNVTEDKNPSECDKNCETGEYLEDFECIKDCEYLMRLRMRSKTLATQYQKH